MSEKMPSEPKAHEEAIEINEKMETLRAEFIHAKEGLGSLIQRLNGFFEEYKDVRMNPNAREKYFKMLVADKEEMSEQLEKTQAAYENFIKNELPRTKK